MGMKLERMNEQQIRCTLTAEDLRERKIKLSELAYGTDKAQSLFRDMMLQASAELDFNVDDEPLMIEAVPMSADCMVLTVTKVDDPDELDTRFARFAPEVLEDKDYDSDDLFDTGHAEDIQSWLTDLTRSDGQKTPDITADDKELARLFSLKDMDRCITLAHVIGDEYDGVNSLYRDSRTGRYLLILAKSGMDLVAFNRICNIVSEYGQSEKSLLATSAFLEEHCEIIIRERAIQQLSQI